MGRVALAVLVLAMALAPSAGATVRLIDLTKTVHRGSYASIIVATFTNAGCSIRVHYGSSRPLVDPALKPKSDVFATPLHWSWKMSSKAHRGRWAIDVACGGAGSLHTTFVVV